MSIKSIQFIVSYTLLILVTSSQSFQSPCWYYHCTSTSASASSNKFKKTHVVTMASNPIDDETEEERKQRMELVRQLQKSFYLDETEVVKPPSKGSTIIEDLPLWRTQWTELPGFQNVLNVHVPHYTNMFQKIIRGGGGGGVGIDNNNDDDKTISHTKYFGHLYLPGGSENLDNPEYKLDKNSKASLTGVLMKITAHEELDDGRLKVVVQALEKFRVVEAKRHHSPYSIATVEIIPDEELVTAQDLLIVNTHGGSTDDDDDDDDDVYNNDAEASAVAEAFHLHSFEFQPMSFDNQQGLPNAVSPLANYDINYNNDEMDKSIVFANNIDNSILELEYKIWINVDEMIRLLQSFVAPLKVESVPIPSQMLGLLPTKPIHPWPENFYLEKYAIKMEEENASIGTYTKSEFVRVDNHRINYPPLRRVHRLSYVVFALTDTMVVPGATDASFTRQNILELNSLEKRLDLGLRTLQLINVMIRNVLNQNR